MLNKIQNDVLKPGSPARDTTQQGGSQKRSRQQGTVKDEAPADDVVMLSIAAVRALVREEAALDKEAPELLRKLAVLEQHGFQNLPVLPGRSVASAIHEAASFLSSSR